MTGHKTIFSELLNSDLPLEEVSAKRLGEEANIILGAATETTKGALTVATFHLLNNPTLQKKLREELVSAIPENNTILPLPDLEKLPYLTACIQEGILHRSILDLRNVLADNSWQVCDFPTVLHNGHRGYLPKNLFNIKTGLSHLDFQ